MRIFWAIIALLTLAAAGAWYARSNTKDAGVPEPFAPAVVAPTPTYQPLVLEKALAGDPALGIQVVPVPDIGAPTSPRSQAPVKDPPNVPADLPKLTSPPRLASESPPPVSLGGPRLKPSASTWQRQESPASAAPVVVPVAPAPAASAPSDPPKPEPAKADPPKVDPPKVDPPKTDPPKSDPPKPDAPKPADPAPAAPAGAKAKIVPQDDGSVLVDDKYPMKGKGTKDDPYRITWDQLVSAEQTYQPRLGRKVIPDRIKMLDGKFVRISGFIAFPLMAASADEMLMMLNQWDGCCIGQPPTPYDAIEVKLKTAAKGDMRLRTTGTLSGVLRVDPYLVKDWLVSLYVMDEGELSDAAGQAAPGQHAK